MSKDVAPPDGANDVGANDVGAGSRAADPERYGKSGKLKTAAYDAEIENAAFTGLPVVTIVRLVEEDDVVMAELTLEAHRADGALMRAAMGEVFVMENGKIRERRAYVVELKENDYK